MNINIYIYKFNLNLNQKMSFFGFKNATQNQFNIQKIIDFIYSEKFSDILIEEKTKFIKNIEIELIDIIKHQNKFSKTDYDKQLSLFEKEKINIINRYEKDYSLLKKELIKYEKYPNEIQYLNNYRKHCINLEKTPLHKCNQNKFGKFIEVFEEKRRKYLPKKTTEKSLYVICSECNKCYNINFIKMFCTVCKNEYYSSKLDENENENILPATWKEYHCIPIIVNESMKCIKCESVLYINLYNKKLVCLNKLCNFISDVKSIIWKCKLCQQDFTSEAKIFNPLENKILQNSVFKCLLNKEICFPQKLYCCCLIKRNTKYFHNRKCDGELYKGLLENKSIVVCSKCHAVNYYEKFIWICPSCHIKFYYNGKKYKKENDSVKSSKTLYSLEKYEKYNNINNNINKAQRNLSSNIRVFIHNFDDNKIINDKNKMTLENNDYNNIIYNKNTFDNSKRKILEENSESNLNMNGYISKYKYQKRKKNLRYRTLYDILKEKKNQRNKSINNINYNITDEINNTSYQYRINKKNLEDQNHKTATKQLKNRKNLIQNYIYKNDIVVNININSNHIKNTDNIINISNISNSDKIIKKGKIFEKIEETENENNMYEYESIRKNLHQKFQNNSGGLNYNINSKNNELRTSFVKDNNKNRDLSNEKYKLVYNSRLTMNEKEKEFLKENKNEINDNSFYQKKNIRNIFFKKEGFNKNNTLNAKTEDNNENILEKKLYRKFRRKENKNEEIEEDNNNLNNKHLNDIKIYNSSRLKQNKFHKKLFLDKSQQENINNNLNKKINNNTPLNDIPEYDDNSISISPLGDIGSSIISKDDFLKISKECKIPSFDENNISYIRPIGQGSFGVIYLVEEKTKKNQYALKSILCNNLEQILKHKKEFELSYSLSHNNFIKIYNALFKYLDMTTYMMYILMERGESDWSTEIEKRAKLNNYYKEKELINILKQLTDVLSYFQKNNIAHRDIKPQNILIFKNGIYKITDLGEAKGAKNNKQLATLKGSQFFMSPNLFMAFKYNGNNTKVIHNIYKSDVFSLGYCFLYAMNLNMKIIQNLREENNMVNIINTVKKFGLEGKYSEKLMNIIYKMIHVDENKRWDFIELNNKINKTFN